MAKKEAAQAAKKEEVEAKKAAKLAEKEAKLSAKLAEKEAKKAEKEAAKLAKKEEKRLAAIAARAEAKASKVPRAKKSTKIEQVEVVLKREDPCQEIGSNEPLALGNKTKIEPSAVLEEEECIEVEEIEWNGRSYLLDSNGVVYNDGHVEVGVWRDGVVELSVL